MVGGAPILDSGGGISDSVCRPNDGLINPEEFPCRASDLQPSRVEQAAQDLEALGNAVRWEMTGIATEWSGMRPWYEAPEQERMLALMDGPADDARAMQEALQPAARHLVTYAASLQDIQRTLVDLENRAWDFRASVIDGVWVPVSQSRRPTLGEAVLGLVSAYEREVLVPWNQDEDAITRNEALLGELGVVLNRLSVAADECENGLNALVTGGTEVVDSQPIPAEAFVDPALQAPWGYPAAEDRNAGEDLGAGVANVAEGLLESLTLIGIDLSTGEVGWDVALESWVGMGQVAVAVATTLRYPPGTTDEQPPWLRPWIGEQHQIAASLALAVGYDAAAAGRGDDPWQRWQDEPMTVSAETSLGALVAMLPSIWVATAARTAARAALFARWRGRVPDGGVPGGHLFQTSIGGSAVDGSLRSEGASTSTGEPSTPPHSSTGGGRLRPAATPRRSVRVDRVAVARRTRRDRAWPVAGRHNHQGAAAGARRPVSADRMDHQDPTVTAESTRRRKPPTRV